MKHHRPDLYAKWKAEGSPILPAKEPGALDRLKGKKPKASKPSRSR